MNTHQFALVGLINDLVHENSYFNPIRDRGVSGCFKDTVDLCGIQAVKLLGLRAARVIHFYLFFSAVGGQRNMNFTNEPLALIRSV